MAQKIKTFFLTLGVVAALSFILTPLTASAAIPCSPGVDTNCSTAPSTGTGTPTTSSSAACDNTTPSTVQDCVTQSPIVKDINQIVNFLGALVGIVVVGVIIMGGIQYSMAGDNPSALSAAKQRIINGLIALVAFMLTYAFVQWLVPGGVFG